MSWSVWVSEAKVTWTPLYQLGPLGNSWPIVVHSLQSLIHKLLGKLSRMMLSCRQQIHPTSFASDSGPLPPLLRRVRFCWRERDCFCYWRRFPCGSWLMLFRWRFLGEVGCGGIPSADIWKCLCDCIACPCWQMVLVLIHDCNRSWVSFMRRNILA